MISRAACLSVALILLGVGRPVVALEIEGRLGRWSASGYGEAYVVVPSNSETPDQRPAGIFGLTVTGDVHSRVRLLVDGRLMVGGWPIDPDGFGVFNLDDTFQNIDPSFDFREVYLDLYLGPVDLRIGKQTFAWGNLDTLNPTDIMNTRWWNDPFITDIEESKIGVPALRASYFLPSLGAKLPQNMNLTLTWIPLPVSVRFPLQDERWFPMSTNVEALITLPGNSVSIGEQALPNPVVITNDLQTGNRDPPRSLGGGAVGVRLTGFYRSIDWSLYFYSGQETQPAFDFASSVIWPGAPQLPPADDPIRIRANSLLVPRFDRIALLGGDAARALGGFTIRAQAAYGWSRLLPRTTAALLNFRNLLEVVTDKQIQRLLEVKRIVPDLGDLFVARDTIGWGIGIDYLYKGWTPIFEVNQTVVLDNDTELLIADVDTQLAFVLRKAFFRERLDMDLVVLQGVARGYTTGRAEFTYDVTDHWRVSAGYLLIAGSRRTTIGQFKENDETYFRVRFSF